MIEWDVVAVRFPMASVRRLTMQGKKVVFVEERSSIENTSGERTESVVQGNVYWLSAKILNGGVDSLLLCAMDDVEVRALEDRAERPGPSTSSISTQQMHIREELTHAETHGPGT